MNKIDFLILQQKQQQQKLFKFYVYFTSSLNILKYL